MIYQSTRGNNYLLKLWASIVMGLIFSLSSLSAAGSWNVTQIADDLGLACRAGITVDSNRGTVYVFPNGGTVDPIHPNTLTVTAISTGVSFNMSKGINPTGGITYDSSNGTLYAGSGLSCMLTAMRTDAPHSVGYVCPARSEALTYNSSDYNLYVLPGDGSIWQCDPVTRVMNQILASGAMGGGNGITYNSSDGYLYVVPGDNTIRRLKPDGTSVVTLDSSFNPSIGIATYPGVAITSNNDGYLYVLPGDDTVQQINLNTSPPTITALSLYSSLPAAGNGIVYSPYDRNLYTVCADGSVQQLSYALVASNRTPPGTLTLSVGLGLNSANTGTLTLTLSAGPGLDSLVASNVAPLGTLTFPATAPLTLSVPLGLDKPKKLVLKSRLVKDRKDNPPRKVTFDVST